MGVEAATAMQLLRAKQNAYYIQAVQDALQVEEQRKIRLQKATKKHEVTRLEKQFVRERSVDRERLQHIQEDHALLLNAKIAEWKATGGLVKRVPEKITAQKRPGRRSGPNAKAPKTKYSKEAVDRLAVPRTLTEGEDDRPTTSNSRGSAETSQELEFYKNVYRKHDRARLSRNSKPPATLNAASLHTMSETELLRTKANLLSELHGVVSMESRIIHDDQCTVRSSVSSWKSNT